MQKKILVFKKKKDKGVALADREEKLFQHMTVNLRELRCEEKTSYNEERIVPKVVEKTKKKSDKVNNNNI